MKEYYGAENFRKPPPPEKNANISKEFNARPPELRRSDMGTLLKGWFPNLHESDIESVLAVIAELNRQRYKEGEGWSTEHDDQHNKGELAQAAECYICAGRLTQDHVSTSDTVRGLEGHCESWWPWDREWWKPSMQPERNLEKGIALALAEYARLVRSASDKSKMAIRPQIEPFKRKIIQVTSILSPSIGIYVIALCNDESVWINDPVKESWNQIPDIPQPK